MFLKGISPKNIIGEGIHTQNLFHVDNYLNCNALDILDRSGIGYFRSWLLKLQLYLDIHIYMSYLRTTVAILLIPVKYLSHLYCFSLSMQGTAHLSNMHLACGNRAPFPIATC